MAVIFGGETWPIGWSVGFIEKPFAEVLKAAQSWRATIEVRERLRSLAGLPFRNQLLALAPLQAPHTRSLLVQTAAGWTAYFDNDLLGGDPPPWVGVLTSRLRCQGVIATHVPIGQYQHPATQFELLGPQGEPPLQYVRSVSCGIFESGAWSFEARGPVQPFEEPEHYGLHPLKDRFPRELLMRYLSALGISADDPNFYGDGCMFEQRNVPKPRTLSLDAARREYGR